MSGHRPPALALLLAEPLRAPLAPLRLARDWRALGRLPRGDGRAVMLLPGLFNGDRSNLAMAALLRRLGYRVEGWGLGRNLGQRAIGGDGARLFARIDDFAQRAGAPVTLVGVSLGGVMARIAAHRLPGRVRAVVTVSAPFAGPPEATNVWRAYQWLSGARIDDPAVRAWSGEAARPLPVPATAIWSARDGLVGGAICRDADCHAIEVASGHLWVQFDPQVLRAVAAALARDASQPLPAGGSFR
ncbi:esterase/lipase family protein [Sphingomonas baiyangensis]|uniref:Alpha/beta fold hydrolase n=1 Tax=Sphingomonas baiyangensis TaxID=2572576 RepID=A0A4V5PZ11_9SPHN|nr:alpha/beta fold hydrolase [Sphingomonas baiyangensis]TKD53168.1 alpha/beta fold hydrolase [Sphingomonas baiyangensis]